MNPFKKLSTRTVNAFLIFLIALAFLVPIFFAYKSILQLANNRSEAELSDTILLKIDSLLSDLQNAETGQRGYVITGKEDFLAPYTLALQNVYGDFQALQDLTKDNPAQQERLLKIHALVDTKLAELDEVIGVRRYKGFDEAAKIVLAGQGKQAMDDIRKNISDINVEESNLSQARNAESDKTQATTETIILWGSIIGFLIYLLINYIIDHFVIGDTVRKPLLEKIEQSLFYARSLIEASLDPLVTINSEGKITDVNEAVVKVTGVSREKLIGTDFLNYFTEPEKAREGYEQVFNKGSVVDYPLVLKSQDGKLTDVLFNASLYKDSNGNVLGVFAAARDNTKSKKASELIQLANKELQTLNVAKDEFVSIASHQLRSPLTAIKGYTGMLLDGDPGPINDKQREYLSEMRHANDRMVALITALLDVSRVDLGVFIFNPEPTDFTKVAKDVLVELDASIKNKKLQVKTDFENDIPLVGADPKITRMIFQNLLTNAVKYTPAEGKISFDIKKDNSSLLISVADTGYGIPKDEQAKIFTKMFRADNARAKDPDGTGLGLYIVKETIEKTGGKIWFESLENQGTTFFVSIPLGGMKKKEVIKS